MTHLKNFVSAALILPMVLTLAITIRRAVILAATAAWVSMLLVASPVEISHNYASAVSTKYVVWDGSGDGIHWSDPKNWKGNKVPTSSDSIVIDFSRNTNIMAHLDIDFTLGPSGTLTIESGDQLTIDQGKTLLNLGTITNNAFFFVCNPNPLCGGINNLGVINNEGTIVNNGAIAPGVLYSSGTINNNGFLYIPLRGNNGELNPVQNIVNSGTINSNSQISITIDNLASGVINNQGILMLPISNRGVIKNHGGMDNFGTVTNYAGGIIDNFDEFTNYSTGVINNYGTITNECGSTFVNNGQVIGNPPINAC